MGVAASLRWLSVWGLALAVVAASGVALAGVAADSAAGVASDDARKSARGAKFAVVIGVSHCEDESATSLPFVENDVALLVETLAARGFVVYPFCEESVKLDLTNSKIMKPQPPTKANVERAFTDGKKGILKNVFQRKDATLLVYFSGHGLITSEKSERTRLFMRDSRSDDPFGSTLRAQTLRELISETPCRRRLLLIDACHAAGTRTTEGASYADVFKNSFLEGGVAGVPTFASCSVKNVSGVLLPYVEDYGASQQKRCVSVFTYWVDEALKGRADGVVDGKADGVVGSDELFEYVDRNLRWMRACRRHWQTPAIVAAKDEKPFGMCQVPSRGYLETIDDLAEQIVTKAKILGKKEIYVEEFDETFASEELRSDSDEVAALHSFAVGASEQLRASVRKKWKALEEGTTTSPEGDATDERFVVNAVVDASLNEDDEVVYTTSCGARNLDASAARLFANARAGIKAKDAPEKFFRSVATKGVQTLKESGLPGAKTEARKPSESGLPEVKIEARKPTESVWQEREIREIAGALWVELNPGETYRVVFEPSSGGGGSASASRVCARLLIDGRNSLPQREPSVTPPCVAGWELELPAFDARKTKRDEKLLWKNAEDEDAAVAAVAPSSGTDAFGGVDAPRCVVAPVVPLDQARYWLLETDRRYEICGFYEESLQTCNEFLVAKRKERAEAVETDRKDERGLIVAAFYESVEVGVRASESVGDVETVLGAKANRPASTVKGVKNGALLGFTRLRYASAEYLAGLEKAAVPASPFADGRSERSE